MTTVPSPLRRADLSTWLRERFIPCWAERVLVPGLPGYAEEFRWSDGAPSLPIEHTTMVTGRLVYTFSMAYRFDKAPKTLRTAEHGLAFLLDGCRLSPGHFAHRVGSDGKVIDPDGDLYDLAFVLLALGGYSAATGRLDVLAAAHEIAARLDHELTDPRGGYREPAGTGASRLQYPQMHLFEAFQMLAAADPSGGWLARAERIVELVSRLVDENGAIDEWFGPHWEALKPERRQREIGHHFEWAWLLFVYATTTGSTHAADIAWRLFDFGLKAANIATSKLDRPILNSIGVSGESTSDSHPLWPTVELAKASLAAAAIRKNSEHYILSQQAVDILISRMNSDAMTWINNESSQASVAELLTPARTIYHVAPCLLLFNEYEINNNGGVPLSIIRPF